MNYIEKYRRGKKTFDKIAAICLMIECGSLAIMLIVGVWMIVLMINMIMQ